MFEIDLRHGLDIEETPITVIESRAEVKPVAVGAVGIVPCIEKF